MWRVVRSPVVVIIIPTILIILTRDSLCHPSSDRMPAMAQKAGGRYRAQVTREDASKTSTTTTTPPPPSGEVDTGDNYDNDSYEYESSEESEEVRPKCPPGKIVFVEGGRCVPKICYGGHGSRNHVTGECHQEPLNGGDNQRINHLGQWVPGRRNHMQYGGFRHRLSHMRGWGRG